MFTYGPADATARLPVCHPRTPSSLVSFKSRLVLPFGYRLTQVVLEKRPLNGCSSGSYYYNFSVIIYCCITVTSELSSESRLYVVLWCRTSNTADASGAAGLVNGYSAMRPYPALAGGHQPRPADNHWGPVIGPVIGAGYYDDASDTEDTGAGRSN